MLRIRPFFSVSVLHDSVTTVYCMDLHVTTCIFIIRESVDSISRDGPDMPIYIIHYKKRNNSEQENFKAF